MAAPYNPISEKIELAVLAITYANVLKTYRAFAQLNRKTGSCLPALETRKLEFTVNIWVRCVDYGGHSALDSTVHAESKKWSIPKLEKCALSKVQPPLCKCAQETLRR